MLLLAGLVSCESFKNKTREIAGTALHRVPERKNAFKDKEIRVYDFDKPDTYNNKKRFKEHLQTDVNPGIKNIYAYGDFLGIDYKVLIAFDCDSFTVARIAAQKNMIQVNHTGESGLFFLEEFKWWNKEKLEQLLPYKAGKAHEHQELLWYDAKLQKAYYEEYSL